jgi:hypothetical protein
MHYLLVDELDEGESPAPQGHFILDENDPLHPFGTLLSNPRGGFHGLSNGLGAGQRVKATEEQNRRLRVADVSRSIIRGLKPPPTALVVGSCTLRIINLHPPPTMLGTRLQGFVESGCGGRAMRRRRWDLYEREQRIHERLRVFCTRELCKAEPL